MYRTTGPLVPECLGLPENILTFRSQKRVYWPDINVNFSLAENILNLRKTDALINWTPPPLHPGEMWEYTENDSGFCNEPFP